MHQRDFDALFRGNPFDEFVERRCRELAKAKFVGAGWKVVAKPNDGDPVRLMLRCGTRIVTFKISESSEFFDVAGSGLGRRFTANPAHLQGDDPVLIAAEATERSYGSEHLAADFMTEAASGTTGRSF